MLKQKIFTIKSVAYVFHEADAMTRLGIDVCLLRSHLTNLNIIFFFFYYLSKRLNAFNIISL